jgi:hypothetical protein
MKFKRVLPIVAVLSVALMGSCQKDQGPSVPPLSADASSVDMSASYRPPVRTLAVVNLRMSGNFVILSKSGITNVYKSTVTGDVGSSPITGAAILLT